VFKIFERVVYQSFIETAQVLGAMPKGIAAGEMMKIPADKHPASRASFTSTAPKEIIE
jgi:hypothetical protein